MLARNVKHDIEGNTLIHIEFQQEDILIGIARRYLRASAAKGLSASMKEQPFKP